MIATRRSSKKIKL